MAEAKQQPKPPAAHRQALPQRDEHRRNRPGGRGRRSGRDFADQYPAGHGRRPRDPAAQARATSSAD
ncbi:MAG: hypothetical protein MZU79_01325 [Anaerotruncus sp.]|nr:hypothetical protein [Anaerotruncus sp.]